MSLCASGTPCSAPRPAFRKRGVGGIGRRQRLVGFDRHEGIETGLPLRDPLEAGLRRPHATRNAFARSPCATDGQRQQGRLSAHVESPAAGLHDKKARRLQIERQRAGDRGKTLERRPDGIGDTRGDFGADRHARDVGDRLDLLGCRSGHAVSAPFAGARLWADVRVSRAKAPFQSSGGGFSW